MIAFPGMLVSAAEKAGIKVPPDLKEYDADEYVYWAVFECAQLGAPNPYPGVHFENAHVVAAIPEDHICKITIQELCAAGFQTGFPIP